MSVIREKVARAIYGDPLIVNVSTMAPVTFDDLPAEQRDIALIRADAALAACGHQELVKVVEDIAAGGIDVSDTAINIPAWTSAGEVLRAARAALAKARGQP